MPSADQAQGSPHVVAGQDSWQGDDGNHTRWHLWLGVLEPTSRQEQDLLLPRSRPWHDAGGAREFGTDLNPQEAPALPRHLFGGSADVLVWHEVFSRACGDEQAGARGDDGCGGEEAAVVAWALLVCFSCGTGAGRSVGRGVAGWEGRCGGMGGEVWWG